MSHLLVFSRTVGGWTADGVSAAWPTWLAASAGATGSGPNSPQKKHQNKQKGNSSIDGAFSIQIMHIHDYIIAHGCALDQSNPPTNGCVRLLLQPTTIAKTQPNSN